MGGYGSGRWGWHRAKTDTDGLLRLDVRWLARQGYLDPGTSGAYAVAWSWGDRPAGDILVRYDGDRPDELVLDYRTRRGEGAPWAPVRERVALDRTPCPYGGSRPWFLCPGCRGRRAALYSVGGRFRCRACHGLAYSSTREGTADRHRRRADELRRRIGCEPGICSVPRKPKGMRWATYERILAETDEREHAALVAAIAETDALFARLERTHGSLPRG
jgi:hypothetical protein